MKNKIIRKWLFEARAVKNYLLNVVFKLKLHYDTIRTFFVCYILRTSFYFRNYKNCTNFFMTDTILHRSKNFKTIVEYEQGEQKGVIIMKSKNHFSVIILDYIERSLQLFSSIPKCFFVRAYISFVLKFHAWVEPW